MNTTSPIEPTTSPAPGIIPEPPQVHADAAASTPEGSRQAAGTMAAPAARRGLLARALAALRGDKYMAGAYAQAQPPPSDG